MTKEVFHLKVNKATNKTALSLFSVVVVLALALSGCAPVRALSRPKATAPEDAGDIYESTAQQNVMAIEVVQSFYDWYVRYLGNATAERAYRSSEYLTESFVEKETRSSLPSRGEATIRSSAPRISRAIWLSTTRSCVRVMQPRSWCMRSGTRERNTK
jgi:hypothetical protein